MIHYATYFDRHYLSRGLALYRSLVRHNPPFVLWVLCLDDETYATLARLRLAHVNLVSLAELERADPALLGAKPGRQPIEYYWTCGPAFLVHLFEQWRGLEMLTYLDADLFFFDDPTPIYQELGAGSILLIESRHSPAAARHSRAKSRFNVGMVVFRRSPEGQVCLRRWREQCLEWCFDRSDNGRFGDQRYLNAWPSQYGGVVVSRQRGASVALWNLGNYHVRAADARLWVDDDPLIFYHFSRLRVITSWLYDPGGWGLGQPLTRVVKHAVYVPYVRELRQAGRIIRAAGGRVHPVDSVYHGHGKARLLARMARHRSFLLVTDWCAV